MLGCTVYVEASRDKPDMCADTVSLSGNYGVAAFDDVCVEVGANVSDPD